MAYPNGFTFNIVVVGNPMARRAPMAHGGGFPLGGLRARRGPRFGLQFSDGTRAIDGIAIAQLTGVAPELQKGEAGIPTHPILRGQGGFGGAQTRMGYWCFPLPPAGPMDLYLEWIDVDIPETRVRLDADAIRAAASHAVTLWEPEP